MEELGDEQGDSGAKWAEHLNVVDSLHLPRKNSPGTDLGPVGGLWPPGAVSESQGPEDPL